MVTNKIKVSDKILKLYLKIQNEYFLIIASAYQVVESRKMSMILIIALLYVKLLTSYFSGCIVL